MLYNQGMSVDTTYTNLRQNLSSILDRVVEDQDVVIVRRKGRDVALLPAAELAGLMETAYLLRSPRNAQRLLTALRRAGQEKPNPSSIEQLRRETGIGRTR